MKGTTSLIEDGQRGYSKLSRGEGPPQTSRESIGRKYTAIRAQQSKEQTNPNLREKSEASSNATIPEGGNSQNATVGPSSGLASTWESMKTGFQNLKSNIGSKKFLPLRQVLDTQHSRVSSTESLDDIFQRLKWPTVDHGAYDNYDDYLDDDAMDVRPPGNSR